MCCVVFLFSALRGAFRGGRWSHVGAAFAGEEAMSAPNWRDHQLEISNGGEAHRLAAAHLRMGKLVAVLEARGARLGVTRGPVMFQDGNATRVLGPFFYRFRPGGQRRLGNALPFRRFARGARVCGEALARRASSGKGSSCPG